MQITKSCKIQWLVAATLSIAFLAEAGNVFKADDANNLNDPAAWAGGVTPTAADIAVWNNTVQVNNTSLLGADTNWAGISILDPALPIVIGAGNTLTLGASGLDMSLATNNLTLSCPIVLGAGQTWNVANGLTLATGGAISGPTALTKSGAGTLVLGVADTYSGGTVVNGGVLQVSVGTAAGTGAITNNNGATFRINTTTTLANAFNFNGTVTIDLNNVAGNEGIGSPGAISGSGDVTFINQNAAAIRTFTLGGSSSSLANFTGSISFGTNSGMFRINDGGGIGNTGSATALFDLGTGTATFLNRNRNGSVNMGALTGGAGTKITQGSSSSGITPYTIGGRNVPCQFDGTISDGGTATTGLSITKVGSSVLTLTGPNTYIGVTTVSAGSLQVGNGGTTGQLGTGSVANNATLIFNRSDNIAVANAISGSGTVIKANANTLTYNGADTSFGSLAINQGSVVLGSAASISSGISVATGASFDVSQNPTFVLGSTLSGSGTVLGMLTASGGTISPGGVGAAATLTFANGLTESGGTIQQMELSTPSGTNDLVSITGDLNASGVNNFVLSGLGGGQIPSGTYILMTYSGNFNGTLANFAVAVAGASATLTNLPNQIAVIITPPSRSAANLTWVGDGGANAWDVALSTNWVNGATPFTFLTGDSVLFNDSGVANSPVNLTATVLPAAVVVNATGNYTLTGGGNISGSTGLIKTNSGILTIQANNNYTGPTIVAGGVLQVFSVADAGLASPLGAATGDATNLVLNGGKFWYSGTTAAGMNRGIMLGGNGGTINVTNSSANFTGNGAIAGSGLLTKNGPGTLTLTAASSYTGGTVISNGVVALGSNSANSSGSLGGVGPITNLVTFYGGTLQLFGFNGSTSPTYNSFYNPLVVPVGQTGTLQLFSRAPSSGLGSSLSGGGTLNLVVNYVRDNLAGDWSAFTGTINVTSKSSSGDEMRIANSFGYANATINLSNGVTMDTAVGNTTVNIGELNGTGGAIIGPGNSSSANPTWSIGWKNTSSTYMGSITNDGVTSLIKVGTGRLTLNGGSTASLGLDGDGNLVTNYVYANTVVYTGSTTISNGVLAIAAPTLLTTSPSITLAASTAVLDVSQMGYPDGSGLNLIVTGLMELMSGQTLAGIGTIRGSNVQADAGSTINVGLPTGTLTITNNIQLFGTVNMNLNVTNSPNCSQLYAQNIYVDPSASLVVANLGPEAGATFQLFNHPVGFSSVTLPVLTGTNAWVNNLTVNGSITLLAPSMVSTAPVKIGVLVGGGNLTLNWPADHTGWRLQVQTNSLSVGLRTNWVDVPGSISVNQAVIPINPANGSVFYQLVYP
jgi:autotransporter-associated beta strand protein